MRLLSALLLLVMPLLAEEEAKPAEEPPPKGAGDIEIGDPGTKIEDAKVARDTVARFEAEFKAAKGPEERVAAVKKLGDWDHAEVLKCATRLLDDRNLDVAKEAAVVCARQRDTAKAGAALHAALKKDNRNEMAAVLLVALGKVNWTKAYKEAEKWFQKDTGEVRKGAARYFGYIRAKTAFRMLAEALDEPRPADVNSPTNPPASYWKARWEEWNRYVPHVRWAISQLVEGETFETRKEAEDWARAEGRKHGIEW